MTDETKLINEIKLRKESLSDRAFEEWIDKYIIQTINRMEKLKNKISIWENMIEMGEVESSEDYNNYSNLLHYYDDESYILDLLKKHSKSKSSNREYVPPGEYCTIDQGAKILHCGRTKMKELIKDGAIGYSGLS